MLPNAERDKGKATALNPRVGERVLNQDAVGGSWNATEGLDASLAVQGTRAANTLKASVDGGGRANHSMPSV